MISIAGNSRRPILRGTALVETALVMSVVLLLMLASINLSIVGFYQMSADAAAFFDAHASALRKSCAPQGTIGHSIFTRIPTGSFSCSLIAGQSLNVPVTGYNFNSNSTRYGGYSIVQGSQIRSTVDATTSSMGIIPGTSNAAILGEALEPQFDEYGVHYNADSNQNPLSWFTNRVDYFTQGENTPPYFVGYRIMRFCGDAMTTGSGASAVATPWTQCVNQEWHGLGLAEYLDTDNWGSTNPGIGPRTATFQWAECHQQLYVQFANLLATSYSASLPTVAQAAADFNPKRVGSLLYNIYQQDNIQTAPPTWSSGVGAYATAPGSGC